jgi:hypothetical protein
MPKKKSKNPAKRTRYSQESRKRKNKLKKLAKELKRNERIKLRNPESKVSTNIAFLKDKIKEYL